MVRQPGGTSPFAAVSKLSSINRSGDVDPLDELDDELLEEDELLELDALLEEDELLELDEFAPPDELDELLVGPGVMSAPHAASSKTVEPMSIGRIISFKGEPVEDIYTPVIFLSVALD